MSPRAPYATGDPVQVLHSCAGRGTELATFTVERVKPLATNGRWRVTTTRCDGTQLDIEVGPDGRDRNDYARPGRHS
ncbi:hypothetical protein OEB99_16680 [Actinotalea sp. M2MS4P-6]|uniref:hypothetical protein n=1 Tax=Actinotalea sp. M2MS4P-6 TaxID=2983762 RepID=UPI0021E43B2F|nr:hypothetical protein [Actinotalea sp. M2MS4P-6]MCV2395953.1 hypothetical protein [Actinotalea sp. M2MS4P-6]